ncbi:hypothetical protein [Pseudoalteromonas sp. OOF1S-7]|uniref:hypothetical protein n=1 Tax=Pseudoalteromonas sp. OOF1S-7 TaxID=2917757 RepID=UPI001EF58B1D|nr:hypothetical protein [Pseudoalteromonas sp. OOF1S-7]MCG7537554.1 hypothetical protein [Pseudoalteromonas sp. OOF1S-7]
MKIKIVLVLIIGIIFTTGCMSSTYGNSFVPVQTNQAENQYTLKIYTGGFAGPEYAKKDLDIEAKKFMSIHKEYVDYKIISQKFELIPSGVTFVVEFIKN